MVQVNVDRLMRAYPLIYLACHRRHMLADESGRRLTAQQASVLDHLEDGTPRRVGELAAHMDVTEATMSIHLSRLQKGGYIVRQRNPKDGRSVLLRLTAKGKRFKSQNSLFDPVLVRELLAVIPAGQLEHALRGLETLGHAAEMVMSRRRFSRKKISE